MKDEVRSFMNEICDLIIVNLANIEETRYDISIKPDGTPLTKSDVFVEELVCNHVQVKLPGVVFVGEETFDYTNIETDGYIVLLDPIDGTENFCSGLKEWGVSFSLWKGNGHLGSFLLLPDLGIRLLTGDEIRPIQSRITGLSSSISDTVIAVMRDPGEYRIIGCAVYNLYNVIRGSFRRFVNPKGAYVWDILPGAMLALEHGCKVAIDGEVYSGQFLDPNQTYKIDIQR